MQSLNTSSLVVSTCVYNYLVHTILGRKHLDFISKYNSLISISASTKLHSSA